MAEPTTDRDRRVALLSDLRVLLNWLEANPDFPLPRYGIDIQAHVSHSNDAEGIGLAHAAAAAAGVEVTRTADGAHHHATKRFGMASAEAVYVERGHMAEYERRQEIARKLREEELAAAS